MVSRKADREGVEQFYKARDYTPLWVSNGAIDERAKAAIAYLATSRHRRPRSDRLSGARFQIGGHRGNAGRGRTQVHRLRAHLCAPGADRPHPLHPRRRRHLSSTLVAPEPAKVLAKLADDKRHCQGARRLQPAASRSSRRCATSSPNCARTAARCAKPEDEKKPDLVKVPEGKILRPGMKDARVIALRKRLDVTGDKENPLYDDAVRDAVKTFQTAADIGVDGNLGPNTVRALNGEKHEAQRKAGRSDRHRHRQHGALALAAARSRQSACDRQHAGLHADAVERRQGLLAHQDRRRQAGQADAADQRGDEIHHRQSDLERAALDHRERISAGAAARPAGARPHRPQGDAGCRTAPCISAQPPGAGNALGRIRFNFPNKFLVYQHDTPDKYLFAEDERAYSHGCMRVQDPLRLRREAVVAGAAERALHRGAAGEDVRRQRDQHQLPEE